MGTRYRIDRRAALRGAAAGLLLTVVPGARVVAAPSLDRFILQCSWRAQGEHGGYYQAVASGIYRRYGIDCEVRAGGPNIGTPQILIGGGADAIMSNGFNAFHYVKANLPFLSVAGILQKNPTALMTHRGVGNDSFAQLRGKPILLGATASSTDSYWAVLRARYGYSDSQLRPYTFNLGPFMIDQNAIQQAFISTEPYLVRKAGIEPALLMLADLNVGDYVDTIDTSRRMVEEKPDLLQRFIDASIEGWMQFLKSEDISDVATLIKRNNQDMTDDEIAFARQSWIDNGIVFSGDALQLGIGAMSDARWRNFRDVMAEVGAYPKDFDYRRAYTLQFVNKRVGLA